MPPPLSVTKLELVMLNSFPFHHSIAILLLNYGCVRELVRAFWGSWCGVGRTRVLLPVLRGPTSNIGARLGESGGCLVDRPDLTSTPDGSVAVYNCGVKD